MFPVWKSEKARPGRFSACALNFGIFPIRLLDRLPVRSRRVHQSSEQGFLVGAEQVNVFGSEIKAKGVAVSESVKPCDADREPVSRLRNSVQVGDVSQAFNHFDLQGSLALITLSRVP